MALCGMCPPNIEKKCLIKYNLGKIFKSEIEKNFKLLSVISDADYTIFNFESYVLMLRFDALKRICTTKIIQNLSGGKDNQNRSRNLAYKTFRVSKNEKKEIDLLFGLVEIKKADKEIFDSESNQGDYALRICFMDHSSSIFSNGFKNNFDFDMGIRCSNHFLGIHFSENIIKVSEFGDIKRLYTKGKFDINNDFKDIAFTINIVDFFCLSNQNGIEEIHSVYGLGKEEIEVYDLENKLERSVFLKDYIEDFERIEGKRIFAFQVENEIEILVIYLKDGEYYLLQLSESKEIFLNTKISPEIITDSMDAYEFSTSGFKIKELSITKIKNRYKIGFIYEHPLHDHKDSTILYFELPDFAYLNNINLERKVVELEDIDTKMIREHGLSSSENREIALKAAQISYSKTHLGRHPVYGLNTNTTHYDDKENDHFSYFSDEYDIYFSKASYLTNYPENGDKYYQIVDKEVDDNDRSFVVLN